METIIAYFSDFFFLLRSLKATFSVMPSFLLPEGHVSGCANVVPLLFRKVRPSCGLLQCPVPYLFVKTGTSRSLRTFSDTVATRRRDAMGGQRHSTCQWGLVLMHSMHWVSGSLPGVAEKAVGDP